MSEIDFFLADPDSRFRNAPMSKKYILSIDQGTSATKCVLIDSNGRIVDKFASPLGETYPAPGWVNQDPEAIWQSISIASKGCLKDREPDCIEAVAFSTQRESMLLWERETCKPISELVSWQDRRTVVECEAMQAAGHGALVRERSGLPLDPMFSALKAKWLLDKYDPDRARSKAGEICLGTIDSFFLSRMGNGEHITEAGNASRTQLLNVRSATWDVDLLALFNIPEASLPQIRKSNGPFPSIHGIETLRGGTPVLAVLGDSHAALFGHGAFSPGQIKATYGTGSSVMGLLDDMTHLHPGICLTIGWDIGSPALAAEANIRSSGATIKWVANLFNMEPGEIADEAERFAASGGHGAVIVPGFNGLGAPWWDNGVSGMISGLTLDSRRESLALGAVEAIPNQIADVVEMLQAGGLHIERLFADGGPTRNSFLMQLQANLTGVPVACSQNAELSALGAAHLAGIGLGWWNMRELGEMPRPCEIYEPNSSTGSRDKERERWRKALMQARGEFLTRNSF